MNKCLNCKGADRIAGCEMPGFPNGCDLYEVLKREYCHYLEGICPADGDCDKCPVKED